MALNYAWEKLYLSLRYAVSSNDIVQSRLASVISGGVHLLSKDDLPKDDESWEKLQKVMQACTCKPAKSNEGTIAATTSQMSDETAAGWLQDLFDIFSDVAEAYGAEHKD